MIKELLLYFARFLNRAVVESIFINGSSTDTDYATLKTSVSSLPEVGRLPQLCHFVMGDSIDKVRRAINGFSGLFLFVDYGTIVSVTDQKRSWSDTLSMAVTIAGKISDSADLIEEQLLSDRTLDLLNRMRAGMINDSASQAWLRYMSDRHQMDPFNAPELKSIGWTLTFSIDAQDLLDVKQLILDCRNEN